MKILSTKKLSPANRDLLIANGAIVDEIDLLEIFFRDISQTLYTVQNEEIQVIFTSKNAVDAVVKQLQGFVPNWEIFVIGEKTASVVESYFGRESIAEQAPYASELAVKICKENYADEFTFFCGNRRLDTLPEALKNCGKFVQEIVAYETVLHPQKIDKEYDAMLFFSPSGIESFLIDNSFGGNTVLCCIGHTTAKAISNDITNSKLTAKDPTEEGLVKAVIDYLKFNNDSKRFNT